MTVLELATPPTQPPMEAAARRMRWPWILLAFAAIGVAGGVYWQRRQKDPLADLELSVVRLGEVEDAVTALGKIEPRAYVDVGAQVSGQLMRLAVAAGDKVEEGALLAEIDPQLQVPSWRLIAHSSPSSKPSARCKRSWSSSPRRDSSVSCE